MSVPGKTARKRNHVIKADRKRGLELPDEIVREGNAQIGDKFASWREGEKIIIVFPKSYRGQTQIPQDAYRGKVGPGLPEPKKRKPRK